MDYNSTQVKIKLLREGAKVPKYGSDGAAAADAFACIEEPITIMPGETKLIPLGFSVEVPDGFFLAALSRSGLALKSNIQIANCPGVVDSDYRGEVGAIVYNSSNEQLRAECMKCDNLSTSWKFPGMDPCGQCPHKDSRYIHKIGEPFTVYPEDRICQVALLPVYRINWKVTEGELSSTDRGSGGFGSTGGVKELPKTAEDKVEMDITKLVFHERLGSAQLGEGAVTISAEALSKEGA